jgi:hypothetical protein
MHAHEEWRWNDRDHVRSLTSIRFLCRECHYLSHNAYWAFLSIPLKREFPLICLFCTVNSCEYVEAIAHVDFAFKLSRRRARRKWRVDKAPG